MMFAFLFLRKTICWYVFFIGLVLARPCSAWAAWDELRDCYKNVTQADSNHDMLLDMNEFLNLIKLYNNTCTGVVDELSSNQLDSFMKWSKCSCMSDPPTSTGQSCCTPQNARIQIPSGNLWIFEQVGLALLCKQALSLSSYMECQDAIPTESPVPSGVPSQTTNPTQTVVNKEITSAPTKPKNPTLSPLYVAPTDFPSLSFQVDDPTLAPSFSKFTLPPAVLPTSRNPTNLPTQAVPADEPTVNPSKNEDYTSPPTPLPVQSKEIPVLLPTPFLSPLDNRPTTQPSITWQEPPTQTPLSTDLPSITWQEPPTQTPVSIPVLPPLESPTSKDAFCINSMRMADADGDQRLTLDEYVVFLRKFIQCTGIRKTDSFVAEAFSLTKCFPNPVGCIAAGATLDISPFYISTDTRATVDDAEIIKVCDFAEGVKDLLVECVDLPTPEPSPKPSHIPAVPTNRPEIPTGAQEIPTITPDVPTASPTNSPVVPTLSPEIQQGPSPPEKCILNLSLADSDDDSFLTQDEFLTYISLQPGCASIVSLTSQQIDTFNELAALCLDEPGADELCTLPRNARVSIDGVKKIETDKQRVALSNVCSKTEGLCTISPTLVDTPAPVTFPETNSPVTPQTQFPAIGQPTLITPDDIPTTSPNEVRPIVPSNSLPGTNSPALVIVDKPNSDLVTSVPATSQGSAPQGSSDGEPTAAPSLDDASPPLGVEDAPPELCINATLESDSNQDKYLSQDEYLSFIQLYSNCDLINILTAEQRAVFQNLACSCLNNPLASPDCCLPGNAKILIDSSLKVSYDTYSLSEICFLTAATFDDECIAPPTMPPVEYPDLDQCSNDLVESDIDKNGLMDKQEYLFFIQKFGQCDAFQSLDLGHYSVFQTMACECVNQGASFECCLPGNATLNISGASLLDSNRTEDQISMLSKICITANGLTTRPCEAVTPLTPTVVCADSLLEADGDSDGFLDMSEYLYFLQVTYANCSGIEWLSLSQRVVFGLMACSCLLEPGAELECCYPGNARINITGAQKQDSDRTLQQDQFLSTLCTASNAAADIGCRTELPTPTPTPTMNYPVELTPSPVVTKASAIIVASPDDKFSPAEESQAPLSNLLATGLLCIAAFTFRMYVTG